MTNRLYYYINDDRKHSYTHMTDLEEAMHYGRKPECAVQWSKANLIGSMTINGTHKPVFDVDNGLENATMVAMAFGNRATILPSRTLGHYHVYVDTEFSWDMCKLFLNHFSSIGVIDGQWAQACIRQEQMYVRKPTVTMLTPP